MEKFLQVKQILSQRLNHPDALNILNNLDLALNIDKRNADSLKLAFMMKLSTQGECTGLMQVFKDIVLTPSSTANKFLPSMPHDIKYEVLQKVGQEYTAAYKTNVKHTISKPV